MAAGIALLALVGSRQDDARAILEQVQKTYDTLASYSDTGTATERLGSYKAIKSFKTLFVRDSGFLFSYTTEPTAREERDWMVVWLENDKAHRFWTLTGGTEDGSVGELLGDIDAQAARSALPIPRLLLGEPKEEFAVSKLFDPQFIGREKFQGVDCLHLSGAFGPVGANVWIDASTYLIRKIVILDSAEGATNDDIEIVYKPVANPTIEKARLVFRKGGV